MQVLRLYNIARVTRSAVINVAFIVGSPGAVQSTNFDVDIIRSTNRQNFFVPWPTERLSYALLSDPKAVLSATKEVLCVAKTRWGWPPLVFQSGEACLLIEISASTIRAGVKSRWHFRKLRTIFAS